MIKLIPLMPYPHNKNNIDKEKMIPSDGRISPFMHYGNTPKKTHDNFAQILKVDPYQEAWPMFATGVMG